MDCGPSYLQILWFLHLLCLWQYERNKPQYQDTLPKLWNICTALTAQSAHKQQKYKINLSVYNAWDILIWISCHDWQGTYAWGTKLEFSSMAVNLGRKVAQLPTKPWLKRFMVSITLIGLQNSFNVYIYITGSTGSLLWWKWSNHKKVFSFIISSSQKIIELLSSTFQP